MFYIISPVVADGAFGSFKSIQIVIKNSYNKNERLKSGKRIEHLFKKGKTTSAFPLKVLFDFMPDASVPLQAAVTVGSRHFKKAVDRNRIKRLMREAYRLQKTSLQQFLMERNKSLMLIFIYTGKELPVFAEIHSKMKVVLGRVGEIVILKNGSS